MNRSKVTIAPKSKDYVTLPLPPSTNHLFATVRGHRVKSKEYRAWLAQVRLPLVELKPPQEYPIAIRVSVLGKITACRDLDNMLKPVGDALVAAGVIKSDSVKYVTEWYIAYAGNTSEEGAEEEPGVLVCLVPSLWRSPS